VAGSCEHSDEPLGSGATELVSYRQLDKPNVSALLGLHFMVFEACLH
jgi:hypothetical protein